MTRFAKIFMIAGIAIMGACSGDKGVVNPVCTTGCCSNCPPPPVETVSVNITSPSQGAVVMPSFSSYPVVTVVFSATATSSTGLSTTLSWTLDGSPMSSSSVAVGAHSACVTGTSSSGKTDSKCVSFTASLPSMSGTLKSINPTLSFPVQDFVPNNGMVVVGDGAPLDTARVGTDGKWQVTTRWALKDTTTVCPVGDGMLPCGKGISVLKKDFSSVGIADAPVVVTIPTGSFANQQVTISLDKARAPSNDGVGFYVTTGSYVNFPVPVGFCRKASNMPITAQDSVYFWNNLKDLNSVFGRQLVTPANESDVCTTNGNGVKGIRTIVDSTVSIPSAGVDIWSGRDFISSVIMFPNVDSFHMPPPWPDPFYFPVQHETIHALGFGHTCAWKTIMYTCKTAENNSYIITREDVAYVLYMMAVVDEMRKLNTFYSILNQKY